MNYYNEIKKELIDNEVYKKVKDYSKNKYELEKYYNVGKLLIEAQGGETRAKYGDRLIRERKFYLFQKMQAVPAQLSWSHYTELLVLNDFDKINYYIRISEEQNLSYRELHKRIKTNEYERLDSATKNKLISSEEYAIGDFVKHPIFINNKNNYVNISEKILMQLILEDISSFMKELGEGFCFIDSEYKIRLGNRYNFMDILLFNIEYNAYVVVELKVTELKKEHIGQIQVYMNYIDENIKCINHNKTIGIIIAKYNIYNTTYELVYFKH